MPEGASGLVKRCRRALAHELTPQFVEARRDGAIHHVITHLDSNTADDRLVDLGVDEHVASVRRAEALCHRGALLGGEGPGARHRGDGGTGLVGHNGSGVRKKSAEVVKSLVMKPNTFEIVLFSPVSIQTKTADGKENKSAHYDAGLSVSNLVIQAHELGLHAHQIGGFIPDALRSILELDEDLSPIVVVAIGKIAPAEQLEGPAYEREIQPRTRLELDEIVLHGKP